MRRCADLEAVNGSVSVPVSVAVTAFLLLTLFVPRDLWAQARPQKSRSPQEESRRKLLKEMGLEKSDQPAPATPPSSC